MSVTTSKNINYRYYRETGPGSGGGRYEKPLAAAVDGDLARVWRSARTERVTSGNVYTSRAAVSIRLFKVENSDQ